jgi:hypothetical protein
MTTKASLLYFITLGADLPSFILARAVLTDRTRHTAMNQVDE